MHMWNLSGLLLSAPDLELNSQPTQSRASPEKGWGQPWTPGSAHAWAHYLILPRVSSLVVHGLGVSAPTLKDQGLILCWRLKVCDQGTWLGQVKTLFQATDLSMAPPLSEVRSWRDTPVCAADRLLGRMWQQIGRAHV